MEFIVESNELLILYCNIRKDHRIFEVTVSQHRANHKESAMTEGCLRVEA